MRAARKPFWSEQWALSHAPPSRGFLMTLGGARHPAERAGPGIQHLGVTARLRPSTRECIGPRPRPRGPTETPKGPQDGPLRAPFSAVQHLRGHLAAYSHAAGGCFLQPGGLPTEPRTAACRLRRCAARCPSTARSWIWSFRCAISTGGHLDATDALH